MLSLNSIVVKNLFNNAKNYALYIFALIFSVALFFSFVLMSNDNRVADELLSSDFMTTSFVVGSVLLIVIVITFVMFANAIFLKRRHKELALFQLIGMTRSKVLRLLVVENAIIYFGSLITGVGFGFLFYRMFLMILLRLIRIELAVGLAFSAEALLQTAILFLFIFILLTVQNFIFLKRTRLLHLLNLEQTSEVEYSGLGMGQVIFGVLGLFMISYGYWLSANMNHFGHVLMFLMFGILFLTITGTYLTFKSSVAFLLNSVRRMKQGHVNINDVLSLTSIMFKMKSNAFLLTLISVISAVSMGLMSFAYIMYYSIDENLDQIAPNDYVFYEAEDMEVYSQFLDERHIAHETYTIPTVFYEAEGAAITTDPDAPRGFDTTIRLSVVSDVHFEDFNVDDQQMIITGVPYFMDAYMAFALDEGITLRSGDYQEDVTLIAVSDRTVLSSFVTYGSPQAIVSDDLYQKLMQNQVDGGETDQTREGFGINIVGGDNESVHQLMSEKNEPPFESRIDQYESQMQASGVMMFIIGFVGLAFLLTSGSILYFKQIGESEDEKVNYQILRKLGFTETEIIKGLTIKMVVTFGVPLFISLLHAYFAVNAGGFIFGSEIWRPMLTVMGIYVCLYSLFGLSSLLYYKKVVKASM